MDDDPTGDHMDADQNAQPTPAEARADELLGLWAGRGEDAGTLWRELDASGLDGPHRGPRVAELTARLATAPGWFLSDPVSIPALAGDVLGDGPAHRDLQRVAHTIDGHRGDRAVRTSAALALWLWAAEEIVGPLSRPLRRDHAGRTLAALAFRFAVEVDARSIISVADRRAEFARTFLFWSGQVPGDEDVTAARSLLDGLDSVAHNARLAQALEIQEHRAAVARRLADARAREAVSRYGPE